MAARILFVCAANICRSPAASTLARDRLGAAGLTRAISVESAGIEVDSRRPWCEEAGRWVEGAAKAPLPPEKRISRPMTRAMTERADLILCADRVCHAGLLRFNPTARSRTFLLREAARLGEVVVAASVQEGLGDPGGLSRVLDVRPRPTSRLVEPLLIWWVAEMNAARGRVPLIEHRRRVWPWRAPDNNDMGIPDAHVRSSGAGHAKVLPAIGRSVDDVIQSLVQVLEPRGA